MTTLTQASRQWANRPADQRFTSLHALGAFANYARKNAAARVVNNRQVEFVVGDDQVEDLKIAGPSGAAYEPTHWAFGQLANLTGAPARYLRKLPAALAADCLTWGMRQRDVEEIGLLIGREAGNGNGFGDAPVVKAATGPNYGRVWNAEIIDALIAQFGDGVTGDWRVPGEYGNRVEITTQNTTLYASDRDMFVFLADEDNRIEMGNRRNGQPGSLARGFFISNSEVGAGSLSIKWFLFDFICMNRIVWGAQNVETVSIRHTSGAPDRWIEQLLPALQDYRQSSGSNVEAHIKRAQETKLDKDAREWLAARTPLNAKQITRALEAHEAEEARPVETIWDATTAITAAAKDITWQDERVAMEAIGGKVLDLVAA